MFLTAENVADYLIARGVLDPDDLVSRSVAVFDVSRRNRNFRVEIEGKSGIFVKQVPGLFAETTGSIYREAFCYDLGLTDPALEFIRPYMATLVDYDPRQHVLAVEILPNVENLNVFHAKTGRFPAEIGALQGRALGTIHRGCGAWARQGQQVFPRMQPWVLTIAQNAETVFHNMGPSTRELVDVLRCNPVLVQGLCLLSAAWRQETLIHGDIKWDNFVLLDDGAKAGVPELRLVDWELADIGDSAWDLGCAFCCYLQHWLATLGADASSDETEALIAKAPHRLDATWPAIRAIWNAYSAARRLRYGEEWREMRRAAAFAAGRLVLTAFEMTIRASNVPRTALLCLQLATGMMSAPEVALSEVLGLAVPGGIN